MKILEERILKDGKLYPGNILKVDSFLNHQMDVNFLSLLGQEFEHLYHNCGVSKILTIEASGIGIACLTAQFFHVPILFAKKSRSANLSADVYASTVDSYTHGTTNTILVSRQYLHPEDRVLLIDDFLAVGNALNGLIDLTQQAGATLVGAGIVIEKAFQGGGDAIRAKGIRVESLARIASMDPETGIRFL